MFGKPEGVKYMDNYLNGWLDSVLHEFDDLRAAAGVFVDKDTPQLKSAEALAAPSRTFSWGRLKTSAEEPASPLRTTEVNRSLQPRVWDQLDTLRLDITMTRPRRFA